MIRPPRRGLHAGGHRLREVERAGDVDIEDRPPLFRRDLLEGPSHLSKYAAGVVHQDVHSARGSGRRGDAGLDGHAVAHVGDHRATRTAHVATQRLGLAKFIVDHIARPDVCAALGERDGDGTPESVRRAGDDGGLAAEVERHDVID